MSGPCPGGASTPRVHKDARCHDRENCTGPGCRVRRAPYVNRIPEPQPLAPEDRELVPA